MAVAGELVPVEVGNDKVGGVEPLEAVAGVALVALQQQYVAAHLSAQSAVGEDKGGDALDLVGALGVDDNLFPRGAEDGGDHLHGGGFAVGAGDGDDLFGQLHPAQNVGTDLEGILSGQAAALAHQFAHKAEKFT